MTTGGIQGSEHPRVDILGVEVSAIDLPQAVDIISGWVADDRREYICVTTVNNVVECLDDPALREIHNRAGLTTPDGMPLVWACHRAGAAHVDRVYGPDLLLAMCDRARQTGLRFFFYGGADGVPELLAERLTERFPGLEVCGTYSPPFRALSEAEDAAIVERLNAAKADIVWVGLGNPKQERWMAAHRAALDAPVLIGVGAAFDLHSGRIRQAPRVLQRAGLEWLFRFALEPKRLWHRYVVNNPRFVVGILRRPPRLVGAPDPAVSTVERLRWRVRRSASKIGLDPVATIRRGPGAGLRIGGRFASGDYVSGSNERPVQAAIAERLSTGDVFLDVGANVGFLTVVAARAVGPSGRVVAVEPMPGNAAALRRNVERNGFTNVTVVEAAASDVAGRSRLGRSAHPGGNALETTGAPPDAVGSIEVDVVTVDALVAAGSIPPPDLVKIDTESGEVEVLAGMTGLLDTHRPTVLVELDAATVGEVETKVAAVEAVLRRHAYDIDRLAPSYPNRSWQVVHLWATPVVAEPG